MPNDNEELELKLSSAKEITIDGPELPDMDLEADAWGYGPPPPAKDYNFKWMLAEKESIKQVFGKKGDPSTVYFQIAIVGKLQDDKDWEGTTVYAYLDTRVFRGREISTAAAFVVKAGQANMLVKNKPLTHKKIVLMVEAIAKKEMVVRALLDWKGSYKYINEKGEEVYDNVSRTYTDFPKSTDGTRQNEYVVKGKDKQEHTIRASTFIARFLAKGETVKEKTVSALVNGNGNLAAPVELEVEEPQLAVASAPAIAVDKKQNKKTEEESIELMLEG